MKNMSKIKSVLGGALILAVMLVGCGNRVSENIIADEVTQEKLLETNINTLTDDEKNIVLGTYVGVDGSLLTFFEDGTATYFFKTYETLAEGNPWKYENSTITWYSKELECDIYAAVENEDAQKLLFKSSSTSWKDEAYIKVFAEPKKLLPNECNEVIAKVLSGNVPEEYEGVLEKEIQVDVETETPESTDEKSEEEDITEEASKDGVNPELKAYLDSYEEFIDEYVVFMKNYMANPGNVVSMLSEYTRIMEKYEDFEDTINKYDSDKMSPADAQYYLEVTARCTQKMLEIYK